MTRTLFLLILTLLAGITGADAQVLSRAELETALQSTKKNLKDLIGAKHQGLPGKFAFRQDALGRTMKDELKEQVLPSDRQTQLEKQLSSAESDLKAGDLPGAQIRLNEVRTTIKAEVERYQAVMEYWRLIGATSRVAVEPRSDEATPPVVVNHAIRDRWQSVGITSPHDEDVASAETAFAQQMESRDYVTALRTTWPQLLELRKRQSADRSQQLLSRIDQGEWSARRSTQAARECAAPQRKSDFAVPAHTLDFKRLEKKPWRGGRGGDVVVAAVVDAQGCLERAFIVASDDDKRMDEQALFMVATSVWWPGQKDGVAIRSSRLIPMRFQDR